MHNQLEAETLIKEAYKNGEEDMYDGTEFMTHSGKKLFTCIIKSTEYEMQMEDGKLVTKKY